MKKLTFITTFLILLFLTCLPVVCKELKTYTFKDFMNLKWIKSPTLSPDGNKILFIIETKDLEENKTKSSLFTVDVSNGELKQLTDKNGRVSSPAWSPDGKYISYTSLDGDTQIWLIEPSGENKRKITSSVLGAAGAVWSPDGKNIIFISGVYEGAKTEEENKIKASQRNRSMATIAEDFPLQRGQREKIHQHLFIMSIADLKPKDISLYSAESIDLKGSVNYNFSPDGNEICFVSDKSENPTQNKNHELFIINLKNKTTNKITENKTNDFAGQYSPNGRYIAYLAVEKELSSGLNILTLYDRKNEKKTELTSLLDLSISEYIWTPDSQSLFFAAEAQGYKYIYKASIKNKKLEQITQKNYSDLINISPDGNTLYFRKQGMNKAIELYSINLKTNKEKKLTELNSFLSDILLDRPEHLCFTASDKQSIHGFIIKPPNFVNSKKYPLIYLIHGGPHMAWSDAQHPMWSMHLLASQGYVVAMLNYRGSTGYGQKFTDEILHNWGGRPYQDLMEGIDYILENYDYIDGDKMAIVGHSYGGYMVNWIMGHTNRFKCAVSFAGIFNTVSEYGTSDTIYLAQQHFGGNPYNNKELYEKWNPINYAANFKTPCLIVHGEADNRVPISQSKELFTALKTNNVPVKFLSFFNEGHSIYRPQNLEFWYQTMDDWFAQWLK